MVNPLTPDNARGWLGTLMPLLERSTPITMLLLLLLGAGVVWHLLGQITTERTRVERLAQWLLDEKAAHLALALKCGQRDHTP